MSRAKRKSNILETAKRRLAGLKSITENPPDFGSALTLAAYQTLINQVDNKLSSYNQGVASLDDAQNEFNAVESELNDLNIRMLAAAEGQYGPDSSEYEQAGGTRRSERKKAKRKGAGSSGTA